MAQSVVNMLQMIFERHVQSSCGEGSVTRIPTWCPTFRATWVLLRVAFHSPSPQGDTWTCRLPYKWVYLRAACSSVQVVQPYLHSVVRMLLQRQGRRLQRLPLPQEHRGRRQRRHRRRHPSQLRPRRMRLHRTRLCFQACRDLLPTS